MEHVSFNKLELLLKVTTGEIRDTNSVINLPCFTYTADRGRHKQE